MDRNEMARCICNYLIDRANEILGDSVADSEDITNVLLDEWDSFVADMEREFEQNLDDCVKRIIQESD